MKKIPLLVFHFLFCFTCFAKTPYSEESKNYLEGRIEHNDKRYETFLLALDLLKENNAKVLVETGTARNGNLNFGGDGGSTIIFGDWASQNGAKLYSVDIASWAIANARNASVEYKDNIHFVLGDSIEFLENFDEPIDFLYLDSFDYDWGNPIPSQEHHLKEIIAAYPALHDNSIIMIDDCKLPHGGKGRLVIEFLTAKGWSMVCNEYQVILTR